MAQRTLNGWKVREHPGTGTFVAPNGKTVYCADDDVAEVFRYIVEQWDKRIEPLPKATHNTYPNERKGYIVVHCSRPMPVNGVSNSNHMSHTAIDVLGDKHHYERSCSLAGNKAGCWGDGKAHPYISGFSTAQVRELRAIAAEVDKAAGKTIIRLGIDFAPGWRDAMHVELAPGTTNADVAIAAQVLRAVGGVIDLTHQHTMLLALGYTADTAGVRTYQADRGLTVDGKPGPITTAALEADMTTIKEVAAALAAVSGKVDNLATVKVHPTTAEALATGQTGPRPLSWFLDLVGRRVGRADSRAGTALVEVRALTAAVEAIGVAAGLDEQAVKTIVRDTIASGRLSLDVD